MTELSAPNSSITGGSDFLSDKLKEQQKTKTDQEQFIRELFVFLQKKNDQILNGQFDQLQAPLKAIAENNGYPDLSTALNLAKNARGQTALVKALQDQEFGYANALTRSGAQFDALALDELDLALDSERGQKALADGTIALPDGFKSSDPQKLHIVKEYGLVLGIEMTSKDGTSSQRAHIGPTYKLMTNAVSDYSKSCSNQPEKGDFKQIASAFSFANDVAKYKNCTPTGVPVAGAALSQRIQAGEMTTVPISCKGHSMGLSFAPVAGDPNKTYLIFTNRGEGAEKSGKYGTQIYEVDKRDITPQFLNSMMSGHQKGLPHDQVMQQIHQVTKGKEPVCEVTQAKQRYDNCSVVNSRSNIHGMLLCQEANRKGGFDKVNKEEVKERYKDFTEDMKSKKVQELGKALAKDPDNPDLKALAKGYIDDKPDSKHRHHLDSVMSQTREHSVQMRSP